MCAIVNCVLLKINTWSADYCSVRTNLLLWVILMQFYMPHFPLTLLCNEYDVNILANMYYLSKIIILTTG